MLLSYNNMANMQNPADDEKNISGDVMTIVARLVNHIPDAVTVVDDNFPSFPFSDEIDVTLVSRKHSDLVNDAIKDMDNNIERPKQYIPGLDTHRKICTNTIFNLFCISIERTLDEQTGILVRRIVLTIGTEGRLEDIPKIIKIRFLPEVELENLEEFTWSFGGKSYKGLKGDRVIPVQPPSSIPEALNCIRGLANGGKIHPIIKNVVVAEVKDDICGICLDPINEKSKCIKFNHPPPPHLIIPLIPHSPLHFECFANMGEFQLRQMGKLVCPTCNHPYDLL